MGRGLIFAFLCAVAPSCWAADPDIFSPVMDEPLIAELRLGVFAHDPDSPEGGSADLNLEAIFAKPWGGQEWYIPNPHLGATVNFDGRTSVAYAGLTWQVNLTDRFFLEAAFGGGINNGESGPTDPDMNALGCRVLFRESASLGFDINESWRVMASVEHHSNAGLCDHNRGLTNYGIRAGYKF